MTVGPMLDPAVEEVLVDLAKQKERTLFACDPAKLARSLGGANQLTSANATGLLPVERHLLATMRNEVLELLLCAAREALFESANSNLVEVRARTPRSRWTELVADVLASGDRGSNSGIPTLESLSKEAAFTSRSLSAAVRAARQLSGSPRVEIYGLWAHLHRRSWASALVAAPQVLHDSIASAHRRSVLEVMYIAFDAIGRFDHAYRCAERASVLATEEQAPVNERVVYSANGLVFALLSGRHEDARALGRVISECASPSCEAALSSYSRVVRRNRHRTEGERLDRSTVESIAHDFGGSVKEVCLALA